MARTIVLLLYCLGAYSIGLLQGYWIWEPPVWGSISLEAMCSALKDEAKDTCPSLYDGKSQFQNR